MAEDLRVRVAEYGHRFHRPNRCVNHGPLLTRGAAMRLGVLPCKVCKP